MGVSVGPDLGSGQVELSDTTYSVHVELSETAFWRFAMAATSCTGAKVSVGRAGHRTPTGRFAGYRRPRGARARALVRMLCTCDLWASTQPAAGLGGRR